jgi:GT2 family glycosyltransferase
MCRNGHDVIICVHNAREHVERCLDSLLTSREGFDHLILVDDCSDEETSSALRSKAALDKICLVRLKERHGYTKAANIGLLQSDARIRTLLNSDTIVSPGWSAKIQDTFGAHPGVGIVGPLSNAASHQSVPSVKGSQRQTAINSLPPGVSPSDLDAFCESAAQSLVVPYVPLVHGFCLSVRSSVISRIGLFDEKAFPDAYGEETDFCLRAMDEGFALAIAVNTYVFHAKSRSYPSNRREDLMRRGMEVLRLRYSAERIRRAVEFMEMNPILKHMRQAVKREFYTS